MLTCSKYILPFILFFISGNICVADVWPVDKKHEYKITGSFGEYRTSGVDHFHGGADVSVSSNIGEKVLAIRSGSVVSNLDVDYIYIKSDNTYFLYDHTTPCKKQGSYCEKALGDTVTEGQVIGTSAEYYNSNEHLHLEERIVSEGIRRNPLAPGGSLFELRKYSDHGKTVVCPMPDNASLDFFEFYSEDGIKIESDDAVNPEIGLSGKIDITAKIADRKGDKVSESWTKTCNYDTQGRFAPYKICYNLKKSDSSFVFGQEGVCNVNFEVLNDPTGSGSVKHGLELIYDLRKNNKDWAYYYNITNSQTKDLFLDLTKSEITEGFYDVVVWADDFDGNGYNFSTGEGVATQRVYIKNNGTGNNYEPNDSYTEAKIIKNGITQTHGINPANDVDWLEFVLLHETQVNIETFGTSGDTKMWLYNQGLSEVGFNDDKVSNSKFSKIVKSLSPGTYYIAINSKSGIINSYNISIIHDAQCITSSLQKSEKSREQILARVDDDCTAELTPPNITSPGTSDDTNHVLDTLQPTFHWEPVSGYDQFRLYISEEPYGETNLVYNEVVSGTSKTLPSGVLLHGIKYRWNMSTVDSAGNKSYVSERRYFKTFTDSQPPTGTPSTPSIVTATDGNYPDKVEVSWLTDLQASHYEVYRCTTISSSSCGSALIPETMPYPDTGGASHAVYYYRVKACNSTGCSDFSNYNSGYRGDIETNEKPDLVALNPDVGDSTPETGQSITVSVDIKNVGNADSTSTRTRFYLSNDSIITTSDDEKASESTGSLNVNEVDNESESFSAPTITGRYWVGACVDVVSDESDTENNCSTGAPIDVEESASADKPDLVVINPEVSDSTPETGQEIRLSVDVKNIGAGEEAESTRTRFFLSSDSTITASDSEIDSQTTLGLAPNEVDNEHDYFSVPSVAGQYWVGACVDIVSNESDTGNNCSVGVRIDVEEPESSNKPDLVVLNPDIINDQLETQQSYELIYSVKNIGTADQIVSGSNTKSTFYQSLDSTIDTNDTFLVQSDFSGSLKVGEEKSYARLLKTGNEEGVFWIGVCLSNVNDEDNTGNNCSAGERIEVKAPAGDASDLKVTGIGFAGDINNLKKGDLVTPRATIKNIGTISSIETSLRYYFSLNDSIDVSDIELGVETVAVLSGGQDKQYSKELVVPNIAEGSYWFGVCIDTYENEANKENNCFGGIKVTIILEEPKPDLVIQDITLDKTTYSPEENVELTFTAKNIGDADGNFSVNIHCYLGTEGNKRDREVCATSTVDALAQSASEEKSVSVDLSGIAEGSYVLTVVIDKEDFESESNDTNNEKSSPAFVVVKPETKKADLIVSASLGENNFEPGEFVTVDAKVSNLTTVDAPERTLRYYFSNDSVIDTHDNELGTDILPSIVAGQSLDRKYTIIVPEAEGHFWYGACVDTFENELNADNNCSSAIGITVEKPEDKKPDLVIEGLTIDKASYTKEEEISLDAMVKNIGTKEGELLLGIDCYIGTETDKFNKKVCNAATTKVLAVNETEKISQQVPLSSIAEGSYILTVVVDEGNSEPELNENNNEASSITFVVSEPEADSDEDNIKDEDDNCPATANTDQADLDSDGVGDACDEDKDGDGIDNNWEIENGLDPLDASDASQDADGDGKTNLEEFTDKTNPNTDSVAPEISHSGKVILTSTDTRTSFDLALFQVVASDTNDGDISAYVDSVNLQAPTLQAGKLVLEPGRHELVWKAKDTAGNTVSIDQIVDVLPQANLSLSQSASEGQTVTVRAILNGNAPEYPVIVPLLLSGSAKEGEDYTLPEKRIVVAGGVESSLNIALLNDDITEGEEQIILTMGEELTHAVRGSNTEHRVNILVTNEAPKIAGFTVQQDGYTGRKVAKTGGNATISVAASDPNSDQLIYSWSSAYLHDLTSNNTTANFTFDPSQNTEGVFSATVSVSDGEFSVQRNIPVEVIARREVHSAGADSDGDGIADADEPDDKDNNGVPDYMEKPHSESELTAGEKSLIRSPAGTKIIVGIMGGDSGKITEEQITEYLSDNSLGQYQADASQEVGSIYSYIVEGLAEAGESIPIIIQLEAPVPLSATVKKYTPLTGWRDFIVDGKNKIESLDRDDGTCPESAAWTSGLVTDATCLRLTIEDGGLNDADGKRNSSIDDPVAITAPATDNEEEGDGENEQEPPSSEPETSSSSSGGGVLPYIWLIALFALALYSRCRKLSLGVS